MKPPRAPQLDERRAPEFAAELRERARAWIPAWDLEDDEGDFGCALLQIAARFNSDVAERFDQAGDKMRRGFLDWLAVRGQAARPARMPVVFKLTDNAREAVLAPKQVRMQADAAGTPVVFETEESVRVIPGRLEIIVGVDADEDAFYLPPPGLNNLQPLEPLPEQWQLKSFAAAGRNRLQLDPEAGLIAGTVIEAGGLQYRITESDKDLVTIEPRLEAPLQAGQTVFKVTTFSPFDGKTRNEQKHALYLGDSELFNVTEEAEIQVVGAPSLITGVTWQYWGKVEGKDEEKWQDLKNPTLKNGAISLAKPKGDVVPYEVGGKKSRWIRALMNKLPGTQDPLRVEAFGVRINPGGCEPISCPQLENVSSPAAEAMANTTPIPLDNATSFLPLGREPRQFDAFYLGSQEAFSKIGAEIQLCLEMADASFSQLGSLRIGLTNDHIIAGVGGDGRLHLLRFTALTGQLSRLPDREPLRPPSPGPNGATVDDPPVTLDARPTYRPAMWAVGNDTYVAVTANDAVWVWREVSLTPQQSGWHFHGVVGPVNDSNASIDGVVHLAVGAAGRLYALRDKKLFVRRLNATNPIWEEIETLDGVNPVALTKIAPVLIENAGILGEGTRAEGLVGVADDGSLYAIDCTSANEGECVELLANVATNIAPAAVRRADDRLVAVAIGRDEPDRKVYAFLSNPSALTQDDQDERVIEWPVIIRESIDVNISAGGRLNFAFCSRLNVDTIGLHMWGPFDPPHSGVLFRTQIPAQARIASGAPTLLPGHVIVPVSTSEVIVATFDPDNRRLALAEELGSAIIATEPADLMVPAVDYVAIPTEDAAPASGYQLRLVPAPVEHEGETLYEFDVNSVDDDFFVYRSGGPAYAGTPDPNDLKFMTIDPNGPPTPQDTILLITTDMSIALYTVVDFDPNTGIAELDTAIIAADPNIPVAYQVPQTFTSARLRPFLHLDPLNSGNWNAGLLDRTRLVFPLNDPELQNATAFQVDAFQRPVLVALQDHWNAPAVVDNAGVIDFIVDASIGDWMPQLGDTGTNPELSWEYWNGTGWWKLDPVKDGTSNFKRTGVVEFTIPADLKPTDVSGKNNHWVRARLVGGDYGREKVTVSIKNLPNGDVEQTIKRSTEGIQPPSVLRLHITYAICKEVKPEFVLAQDSGTIRNQSDANRTSGAVVEAFVPLAVTLGRLSKSDDAAAKAPEACPPECDCGKPAAADATAQTNAPQTNAALTRASGRALFVGLAATPIDAPVNVLLLVEERDHTALAPLRVATLVANSFEPIVASDDTRALGESGLLSMSFSIPPTRSDLFGQTALTWLRLTPKTVANAKWNPTIRGAYLNAVWASATETLTRELLGSSDGRPHLTVRLARPPVLHDTLELRVKEPLGEEERTKLLAKDPTTVLRAVEGLPGDWVLWKPVTDPDDEDPGERVYALDETNGEIRFGDGLHGAIPPIGRDSIVAFQYSRTERDPAGGDRVPANSIIARATLNLVSPVESVESVTVADHAAGGASTESDDRVLRFGFARFRHRGSAVTARDIEDLALQSSPDIVQARAVVRRGYIRLVVVMRGANPKPTAAEVRELRRLLLAAGPVSLSAPGALRIEGPRVRRLRIELTLRVETLDDAGTLTDFVKKRLAQFFDTATGGLDCDGWPLGIRPTEDDVALALIDAPDLQGIAELKLLESTDDPIEETDLVMLASDPFRIEFDTAEVFA